MCQAEVEGKEESQEEAVSAQGGHHPQHCQKFHTYWVSEVRKEPQSPRRLQSQGLAQPQNMVIHLGEREQHGNQALFLS